MPSLKAEMKAIAVEPMEQMLVTDAMGGEKLGVQGPHKIQGMGAGLVPKVSYYYHSQVCSMSNVYYTLGFSSLFL